MNERKGPAMNSLHALLPITLGALFAVYGCAGYRASAAPTPTATTALEPHPETPGGELQAEPASAPRVGVQKPSDDTRINSGAGNAQPMSE